MSLLLGFVHAEIVLIKRQMMWTNCWLKNVVRTVLIIYLIIVLIQGCIWIEIAKVNLITEDLIKSNHLGESLSHSENNSTDCITPIFSIRKQCAKNIITGHLNINSLRNKFELIKEFFFNNIDVFSEWNKTRWTFTNNHFQIESYKNIRLDRNCYEGAVCMYVNQDIAARRVKYNSLSRSENNCLELNLRRRKLLVTGIYKPPSYSEDFFIKSLFACLTNATKDFENIVLLEEPTWPLKILKWNNYFNTFYLESLITSPTYFKSVAPTCIDLMLTSHKQCFMKSQTLVTGVSDFHALTLTIMRKGNPKTKFYRDYENFDREMFESELCYSLQSFQLLDYTYYHSVFLLLLNKYAPIKKENYGQIIAHSWRKPCARL